ncbi:polyprenyl synthetase family protein [Streptomyces albireticuli]|uniref:polyprenyl synthetase family protein n=1 Tax=Streptomyces albireticuli TaxID=1940 RepID=UPI00147638EA|nr:polyprenyl synthetase family protein [Streptomyces albireticuli]
MELFHSFALIHDDLMDDSDTRRDPLALHRLLTDRHCDSYRPDAAASRFGAAAAC